MLTAFAAVNLQLQWIQYNNNAHNARSLTGF